MMLCIEDILECYYNWFVNNKNYEVSIDMKIVGYNLVILLNHMYQRPKKRIMDVVV